MVFVDVHGGLKLELLDALAGEQIVHLVVGGVQNDALWFRQQGVKSDMVGCHFLQYAQEFKTLSSTCFGWGALFLYLKFQL